MEQAMTTTTTCPTWCQLHESPDEVNSIEWSVAHMGLLDGVTIERTDSHDRSSQLDVRLDELGQYVSPEQIPVLVRQLTAAAQALGIEC
jgi:hypothetical protein